MTTLYGLLNIRFKKCMGYDCSIMIKTDFRKRHDRKATLKKLEETAAILNSAEGANSYVVCTDDSFNQWCIREGDDEQFFMELGLFNGFWHMETGFHYSQYFYKAHSIRRSVYEYVKLLGEKEAWPCDERFSWNSHVLSDYCRTFEDWVALCEKELGKKIEKLNIRDVMNRKDQFYQGDLVYYDSFEDYHQKEKIYKKLYSDYDLLEMLDVGPLLYLKKDGKKYMLNIETNSFLTDGPIDSYQMVDTCHYFTLIKDKKKALFSNEGTQITDFRNAHFYSKHEYEGGYHNRIRDLDSDFVLDI